MLDEFATSVSGLILILNSLYNTVLTLAVNSIDFIVVTNAIYYYQPIDTP